ncbi:MAG: hypothetical protein D4R73_08855 [Deltaproteobacteria bacterium]|nr:MAG: hypothetical protein D4R73_08855 [Deltaproteobacteria bacterium]
MNHHSAIYRRGLSLGANCPVVDRAPILKAATPKTPPVVPEEIIEVAMATVLTKRKKEAHRQIALLADKFPDLASRLWKICKKMEEEEPPPAPGKKPRPRTEYDWRVVVANAKGA